MAEVFRMLRGYRVYWDTSNTDSHKPHPVYRAILVALDDLPVVQREIKNWRHREGMHGELKWTKVRGGLLPTGIDTE